MTQQVSRRLDPFWSAAPARWIAFLAVTAPFVLGWFLVGGGRNVPVMDDWVYASSVEHLLAAGELRVPEYSALYPVAQIAWGTLFSWIGGFSFAALRASTVCLAAIGCFALYLTAREVGCDRGTGVLVALTLALNPVYFAMSFSFMTDVPFVSLSAVTIFFFVSAARRRRVSRIWLGSLFAVTAFLIRPIGIALPLAALFLVPWRRSFRDVAGWVAPLTVAGGLMGSAWVLMTHMIGPLDMATTRLEQLRWWFLVPMSEYIVWNGQVLLEAAFPLAPLILGVLSRRTSVRALAVGAAIAIAFMATAHHVPSPLPDWQTWSLQEISTRTMVDCGLDKSAWSVHVMPWIAGLGAFVGASVLVLATEGTATIERRFLIALSCLHLVFINLLWLYNDRYYLVLVPPLALVFAQAGRVRSAVVAGALAVWAFFGVTGTRDMLAFNEAVGNAAARLEAAGVPPADIDAGYALNGWRLYDHPEKLPPGSNRRYDVPFITSGRSSLYQIGNCARSGYDVVEVVPLSDALWQASDRIYVLKRSP